MNFLTKLNALIWRWLDDAIVMSAAAFAGIGVHHWMDNNPTFGAAMAGAAGYLVAIVYKRALNASKE